MMNKKMIMLTGMLFFANSMTFSAQDQPLIVTENAVPQPLTAEENAQYQVLVGEFKANQFIAAYNTVENVNILRKQEAFLKSQATQKSAMWPYWAGASVFPITIALREFGVAIEKIGIHLPGTRYGYSGYVKSTIFDLPFDMIIKTMRVFLSPIDQDSIVGIMSNLIILEVLPLLAFYKIYKKHNSMQKKQQELEMVRDMLKALEAFGNPQ